MEPAVPVGGRVPIVRRPDPPTPVANRPASDAPIRRVQAVPGDMSMPNVPGAVPPLPEAGLPASPTAVPGGQSLSLEAALYGALTSNPDLVALRSTSVASPEAVEVARRFPATLNPTLWVDVRPFVYERAPGRANPDHKDALYYFSWRQPIELGHQTTHRYAVARAAYTQQQWTVVQAELLALVQTYRFFQTAAYRREKLRVAQQLADFNDHLLRSLRRRLEANQVAAADVALAAVENRAARQQVKAAQQDYNTALTDLRNQIGIPATAGTAEPFGEFVLPAYIPPLEDQEFLQLALQSRPEIHAARRRSPGPARPSTWPGQTGSPRLSLGPCTSATSKGPSSSASSILPPSPFSTTASPWSSSARPTTVAPS